MSKIEIIDIRKTMTEFTKAYLLELLFLISEFLLASYPGKLIKREDFLSVTTKNLICDDMTLEDYLKGMVLNFTDPNYFIYISEMILDENEDISKPLNISLQ